MAEELALDQLLGDGRAVHFHKRLLAPRPCVVQRVRHQFLAYAALAVDQDAAVGGRRQASCWRNAFMGMLSPTIVRLASQLSSRNVGSAPQAAPDSIACFTVSSVLSMESGFSMKSKAPSLVARTAVSMVPCPEIMITFGRFSSACDSFQRFQTVDAGQPDIEQHHVIVVLAPQQLEAFFAALDRRSFVALVCQHSLQRFANAGFVVNHQNFMHAAP